MCCFYLSGLYEQKGTLDRDGRGCGENQLAVCARDEARDLQCSEPSPVTELCREDSLAVRQVNDKCDKVNTK